MTYPNTPPFEPQAWPGLPPRQPGLICQRCGLAPAAPVTFRIHRGFLVAMSFQKVPGILCRSCGISVFRESQTQTLARGWWSGLSLFLFAWTTLAANLVARRKILRLPPSSAPPGYPRPEQGPPIRRRPAAYIAVAPTLFWIFMVMGAVQELMGWD